MPGGRLHQDIRAALEAVAPGLELKDVRPVSGGSINRAYVLEGASKRGPCRFFVKVNDARFGDMFEAEREGLAELAGAGAIRVPRPLAFGESEGQCWLACEYIAFGRERSGSMARLGEQLARLHRHTAPRFGWHRDNTIGSTPQPNGWHEDWLAFYRERRLLHQLDLLKSRGASSRLIDRGRRLAQHLEAFFSGYRPVPSLLHGDLWGGNRGFDEHGEPVLFDPAVYYGDREADLAMTELFGGFSDAFYDAYRAAWPLDPGYRVRRDLYNLYHVLNHANLFGGGYASQAAGMIDRLLAEAGLGG